MTRVDADVRPRIFDCFTFAEEKLLLRARLDYLGPVVDHFVVVEGGTTFQGTPREYVLPEIWQHLGEYAEKIIYIQVDDFPDAGPWERESHQRNAIMRGLSTAKPADIVIVSDVDEIPRREVIPHLSQTIEGPVALEMNFAYYSLNVRAGPWKGAKAARRADIVSPQALRNARGVRTVKDAGWHLSYLGSVSEIQTKLRSFSHTEYSGPLWTSERHIRRCMRLGVRIFGEFLFTIVPDHECFPGLPRRDHPELYQKPLNAAQRIWAHLYLLATNHRARMPMWVSDKAPILAVLAVPLFESVDWFRRRR